MNFELDHEHRMLADLVTRFVDEELIPLEKNILAREAAGQGHALTAEEYARVDRRSRDLGLWGLDAPEEMGGSNLPVLPMGLARARRLLRLEAVEAEVPDEVEVLAVGDHRRIAR